MRRHNFGGVGGTSHGQSDRLRAPAQSVPVHTHQEFLRDSVWLEEWEMKT